MRTQKVLNLLKKTLDYMERRKEQENEEMDCHFVGFIALITRYGMRKHIGFGR